MVNTQKKIAITYLHDRPIWGGGEISKNARFALTANNWDNDPGSRASKKLR